jgi:hypothetical protein
MGELTTNLSSEIIPDHTNLPTQNHLLFYACPNTALLPARHPSDPHSVTHSILISKGPSWQHQRKAGLSLISPKNISYFTENTLPKSLHIITSRLDEAESKGEVVDLEQVVMDYSLAVFGELAFDVSWIMPLLWVSDLICFELIPSFPSLPFPSTGRLGTPLTTILKIIPLRIQPNSSKIHHPLLLCIRIPPPPRKTITKGCGECACF